MTLTKSDSLLISRIVQGVKKKVPSELQSLAGSFTRLYYANVPTEDLRTTPLKILINSATEMLTFSLVRPAGELKVRVYIDKRDIHDRLVPQTVVEIVNDDMPFLIDSVTGIINSLGYPIDLMIHPSMTVERGEKHVLKNVSKRLAHKVSKPCEAFIHCDIPDLLSPEKRADLAKNLIETLTDVRAAVQDWLPMKETLKKAIRDLKKCPPPGAQEDLKEAIAFLEWIEDNHFTFLGACSYTVSPKQGKQKQTLIPEEGLGILGKPEDQELGHFFGSGDLLASTRRYILEPNPLILTKATQISRVHRRVPMDSLMVKRFNKTRKVIGVYQFVGLFTSAAYQRSIREIPLLRQKIDYILKRSGFSEDWHDGKTLLHILESFPRDELFQVSEEWLFETSMAILQLQNRQRLTLFVWPDKFKRFVSCIVYIPRERYDSELRRKIEKILERNFHAKLTNWHVQFGELAFAKVYYTLHLLEKKSVAYDLEVIKGEIREATLTWREDLRHALITAGGEQKGLGLFETYGKGFSKGYQERFLVKEAVQDILEIDRAFSKKALQAYLHQKEGQDKSRLGFKVFSTDHPISLSTILPILENMNLKVLSENPFVITRSDGQKIWIHDFDMKLEGKNSISLEKVQRNFLESFESILQGRIENDGFNRLIILAQFTWRDCQLVRAYAKYIRQLQGTFSQDYMEQTLAKYPALACLLKDLFTCQFSPQHKSNREKDRLALLNKIKAFLETVDNLDEDRILRKFVNVISATLRTNFYQQHGKALEPYISFKIDCDKIEEMPLPRPKYEIFVYSASVEAIHLRGGNVARGGIRWSDRREDFRTEILGLMKAQMIKNAVIIPTGSKGGFVVKNPSLFETVKESGIHAYQTLIHGLLDLTDNWIEGQIVPPQDVICRDEPDPYLVVAADKGTATFSDYANKIAEEYGFWLGDAFASGGSTGYDHKKIGITARGAWESVKGHFREMGRNVMKENITVVGIGDMSGDVFGNGMLYSPHLKLLGAFNHRYIFIDPSPNPQKSYEERKRLFDLPSSDWDDYNPHLISPGGGVFDRRMKSIPLSPQMKEVFDIEDDSLSPTDLVRALLKAPVDLMWFGGIGTYIKAKQESSVDVGDIVNDGVRINGQEVRARVIAEGANLGLTQQGRIEYAQKGGRLNRDTIDNSGGVDCSDHEVNIKILLHQVIQNNTLSMKKRNALLHMMTDDVERLVLQDNFWQVQAISLAERQGFRVLDEQARLMRTLEEEGFLNRLLEFLPDETEIMRRKADKQGLTRPELSVLLAYAKISLKKELMSSDVPDLPPLQSSLMAYFPERLQNAYPQEIANHPLKRDITVTVFTNSLVNRMGTTFIHELKRQTNTTAPQVAKTYVFVKELLDLSSLWRGLESLEMVESDFQMDLMLKVCEKVKRFMEWFLRFKPADQDINELLQKFKPDFDLLKEDLASLFPPDGRKIYEEKVARYKRQGLPLALVENLIALGPLISAPDMITLAKDLALNVKEVAKIYFALGQHLGFEWLRKTALSLSGNTYWEQEAASSFVEDLYSTQRILTKKVLTQGKPIDRLLTKEGTLAPGILETGAVEAILEDLTNGTGVDFPMLTVMNRHLRLLAQAS